MKVRVYGIRNCDTMKKAFAWLEQHGVDYEFHDYKREGASVDRLAAWSKAVGWEKLANTRGPTWRKIPEADKAGLDERRALALLAANPSAIRRPIVEVGQQVLVGFDAVGFARVLQRRG
ncbi:MAG: arsenate reductase [Steroidobacteraceae bacterium]|jgi:arsenate reductase|nr:arsenate reductase [Steroidobacteraceae bacterium]